MLPHLTSTSPVQTITSMESTASGSSTRLCTLCSTPARYTCPRCSTLTCSLPCSRTHKSRTGCSGERNKAAYVQMNAYGWGTMMRDYCFLEEVGRKVGEWGGEIAREGYATNVKDTRGRGGARRANGRGRGGRGTSRGGGSSKRDLLKAHLDSLDIEMDVLPVGMQRRKVNQSTLDARCALVFRPYACADLYQDAGCTIDDRVQVLPRSTVTIFFICSISSIYHTRASQSHQLLFNHSSSETRSSAFLFQQGPSQTEERTSLPRLGYFSCAPSSRRSRRLQSSSLLLTCAHGLGQNSILSRRRSAN